MMRSRAGVTEVQRLASLKMLARETKGELMLIPLEKVSAVMAVLEGRAPEATAMPVSRDQ
ncbi:hypothetical protein [Alcanivorax sp. S71-1-4]|uniref:hypothetical protein n=1 Tax=Alcanivorax sp. S71-1-4 TaxID=1177159 RepID=UPI0013587622|nr:hypothetical protein [Alcanivorax sp. S71-1-4]